MIDGSHLQPDLRARAGATIIVIDHDLDLLAAADHLIDMGPDGGHIVAAGTPEDVARAPAARPGRGWPSSSAWRKPASTGSSAALPAHH